MRLIKKIIFDRVKEIPQFKRIKSNFEKIQNKEIKGIGTVKEIGRLNFYYIIEYVNILQDRIDYNKIFPESTEGKLSSIDYSILKEEQNRLKKIIDDNQNSFPEYFKKLGTIKEITGCYLIATHKRDASIRNLDFSKKDICISIKMDHKKSLPKEFEQMCSDYSKDKKDELEKEHKEFLKFIKLSNDEQNFNANDFLFLINIQNPPAPFSDDISYPEEELNLFLMDPISTQTGITLESVAENQIDRFDDIKLLDDMLESALERENYELCAKIRDRINLLKAFLS